MKRGMEKAVEDITEKLKGMSKEIKTKKEMENVATVASNNDLEIGKIIAEAMDRVGKDRRHYRRRRQDARNLP